MTRFVTLRQHKKNFFTDYEMTKETSPQPLSKNGEGLKSMNLLGFLPLQFGEGRGEVLDLLYFLFRHYRDLSLGAKSKCEQI
jgi:hypothetical protein